MTKAIITTEMLKSDEAYNGGEDEDERDNENGDDDDNAGHKNRMRMTTMMRMMTGNEEWHLGQSRWKIDGE